MIILHRGKNATFHQRKANMQKNLRNYAKISKNAFFSLRQRRVYRIMAVTKVRRFSMLKKFYDKSKIWFAVSWIILYCVGMSIGDSLSAAVGAEKSVTVAVGAALSLGLFFFLKQHRLLAFYGLCKSAVPARKVLYYLPLLLMLTANLWHGVKINYAPLETALYILSMFFVGFLEEVIFRGLLYKAMEGSSPKAAVAVASITFGMGHLINLFNGSGAELLPNLLQVVYATAAGFLFVMLFQKTGSLRVCILAHGLFNALSVFANEPGMTGQAVSCLLLTLITGGYGIYLAYKRE